MRGIHMNGYDVKCPICGTINRNLNLEETGGWMECEHCQATTKTNGFNKGKKVPVLTMEQATKLFGSTKPTVSH